MKLPDDFQSEMLPLLGEDEYAKLEEALAKPATTSIRLNPRKPMCQEAWKEARKVAWCDEGLYLDERPSFTMDPLFHAGAYYVQEASSMYISRLVRHYIGNEDVLAVDLCAAPGGKSTLLLAELSEGSHLFANEIMPKRAHILLENITKWGNKNVTITNNKASDYQKLGCSFDLILCDVPCSGEGMFRKDSQAIDEWSKENVEMCWQRQREIISDIWECLRPGGIMIYSTCTFNTKEDEENVIWISEELGAEILPTLANAEWNIMGSLADKDIPCCHFMPHRTEGEGFFCAILRKEGNKEDADKVNADSIIKRANKVLRVLPLQGDEEKPVAAVDVDHQTALQYLHGEALRLPAETPRGIITITYKGLALGIAKNIGNRANNLYPKEWRIKKQV